MARTLITAPGLDIERSLGWLALWWIENFVQVGGSGSAKDDLVSFGDEYSGFVARCYALDERGYRLHDSAFFSRPKGSNKSGLAAYLALFEALGPCRFAGWAKGGETYTFLGRKYEYLPGEPMGKGLPRPLVRLMATEEGQVGNVFETVYSNLTEGPLSDLKAYGLDAGLTRIILPEGGKIQPSSAGAASKDGGLETFAVFDETHIYNLPMLHSMYETVVRNLGKNVEGHRQKWFLETTTMYRPGEGSVAEKTYETAELIQAGKTRRSKLLFDHRYSRMSDAEFTDTSDEGEARLRAAVLEALGEAAEWNDVDAVLDKIYDPRSDVRASKRYYLNDIAAPSDAWLEPAWLDDISSKDTLRPGDEVTVGFDGAVTSDATALVVCRVSDGLIVPWRIDEAPDGPAALTWSVDQEAFDAAVADVFDLFDVVGFFADPPYWQDMVDKWENEYGDGLRVKAGKFAIKFWTKTDSYIAPAVERLETDVRLKRAKLSARDGADGKPLPLDFQLRRHLINARAWDRAGGKRIGKESKSSPKKIDGAMAAVLAWEARGRLSAIAEPSGPAFIPAYVRG